MNTFIVHVKNEKEKRVFFFVPSFLFSFCPLLSIVINVAETEEKIRRNKLLVYLVDLCVVIFIINIVMEGIVSLETSGLIKSFTMIKNNEETGSCFLFFPLLFSFSANLVGSNTFGTSNSTIKHRK